MLLIGFWNVSKTIIRAIKEIIKTIISNGIDIIEIGMPFSDPMADGPTIQESSVRSIVNGTKVNDVFEIVDKIRNFNNEIPIILMGYYNSIFSFGIKNFTDKCLEVGVDGLIVVDLQPEEDSELFKLLKSNNIDLIRLITPNTTDKRIQIISNNSSGFLYYVTITGITGRGSADINKLKSSIKNIKKYSNLPIMAGFGINTKEQINEICKLADGAVVGSSIIKIIEEKINQKSEMLKFLGSFIEELKSGTKIWIG